MDNSEKLFYVKQKIHSMPPIPRPIVDQIDRLILMASAHIVMAGDENQLSLALEASKKYASDIASLVGHIETDSASLARATMMEAIDMRIKEPYV